MITVCLKLLWSAEAAEDGQVGPGAAGHRYAGAAWSWKSRSSFLSSVLHIRCSRRRAVRSCRQVYLLNFQAMVTAMIRLRFDGHSLLFDVEWQSNGAESSSNRSCNQRISKRVCKIVEPLLIFSGISYCTFHLLSLKWVFLNELSSRNSEFLFHSHVMLIFLLFQNVLRCIRATVSTSMLTFITSEWRSWRCFELLLVIIGMVLWRYMNSDLFKTFHLCRPWVFWSLAITIAVLLHVYLATICEISNQ